MTLPVCMLPGCSDEFCQAARKSMNQYAVVVLIMSALKTMHHILAISPFVLA